MPDTELPLSLEDLELATAEVLGVIGVKFDEYEVREGTPERLMARVVIHGTSDLDLTVEAPAQVAAAVAAVFFGTDGEGGATTDLPDAMGELANITAGAIKPMLDGHWTIGIPDRFGPQPISSDSAVRAMVPLGRGLVAITVARSADAPVIEKAASVVQGITS